jgi:Flp pilus assembly protein TadB
VVPPARLPTGNRGWAAAVVAAAGAMALLACPAGVARAAAAPGVKAAPVVMILLDTQGLTPGKRIREERQAALSYLAALPAGVRAGLITFNTSWQLRVAPTADRRLLARALGAVRVAGAASTGIYAAISAAESVLSQRAAGPGRLLVLSNAENVPRRVMTPPVPADVVRWHYDGDDNMAELGALASGSGGHIVNPPLAASLAAVFRHPAPAGRASRTRAVRVPWLLAAGMACAFLATLLVALLLLRPLAPGGARRIAARIERYGPQHAPAQSHRAGPHRAGPHRAGPGRAGPDQEEPDHEAAAVQTALGLASSMLRSTRTERGLAQRLDHAGIGRSPAEWTVLAACTGVVLAGALTLLTGSVLLGIPAGGLLAWLAMRLVLSLRTARRRAAFGEQLPEVLRLIAGSLQSGFSLPQAVDSVVREDSQPAAGELSRALAEVRVGADLGDALTRVADRMDSADLHLTVMAVRIQREVGGNLAEVLHNSVGTMRERAFLRRQVRALSAEGRMSAYILLALPFLVGTWFFYVDPAYMRLLYTTVPGLLMLAGSGLLILVGVLWMRKLIDIEV